MDAPVRSGRMVPVRRYRERSPERSVSPAIRYQLLSGSQCPFFEKRPTPSTQKRSATYSHSCGVLKLRFQEMPLIE